MNPFKLILVGALVASFVFSGCLYPEDPVDPVCSYDGKTYNVGDKFPSSDGCNTCVCDEKGNIACTEMACVAVCNYEGTIYYSGDSWKASDGCNTCSCTDNGLVACTKKLCLPACDPKNEPYRQYVGGSPEQCQVIKFVCAPGASYFANDCGCGCEQPKECPQWLNCMPGPDAGCSQDEIAAFKAKCPLSGIAY
ncbi:MAG: hypothetical protein KC609_04275 [Myxococcales bacterium]|nr:hypothetical protein [Myxococcales bacterium]